MSASFLLTFTLSWTFLAELSPKPHRCVEILSRGLFHSLHGDRSETGLIEFRPCERHRGVGPSKLAEATLTPALILLTSKPVRAKTRRQPTKSEPMAELRSLRAASGRPGTEQLRPPWRLGSTDSHCDHPPPHPPSLFPPRRGQHSGRSVPSGRRSNWYRRWKRRSIRAGVVGGEKGCGGKQRRSVACLRGRDRLF